MKYLTDGTRYIRSPDWEFSRWLSEGFVEITQAAYDIVINPPPPELTDEQKVEANAGKILYILSQQDDEKKMFKKLQDLVIEVTKKETQ